MASLTACGILISFLLFGMGTISFKFGTSSTDLFVTIFLFSYLSLLSFALLRSSQSSSTRPPSPTKRAIRLLFPLTFLISILLPVSLLLLCPALGSSGLARHTWNLFAQLVFETIAHVLASRVRIAVLPRLAGTAAFIVYRLPIAGSWAIAPAISGVAPRAQAISRGVAVANAMYWAIALFWFLILVCVPHHVTESTDENDKKE